MTGHLYVDGRDVYRRYGVYVIEGGWNELVAMPPLKDVTTNDWQEEDGVEADLSAPVLDTREVNIKFAVARALSSLTDFIDLLSDGAYHTFVCVELGSRAYRLRLTQQPSLKGLKLLGHTTLRFADDFPLWNYSYAAPSSGIFQTDDYLIDDVPLTAYGVRVLQGTLAEITRSAAVKENMLREIAALSGVIYDPETVTYESKEVKLYCLMRADTLAELWANWDALLYNLTQPDERLLWVEELEREFPFYYKECAVTEFHPTGRIWLQFTLTVVFTSDFRLSDEDVVLAAEDGSIVYTEDDTYAIEMKPDSASVAVQSVRLVNTTASLRLTGGGALRFND